MIVIGGGLAGCEAAWQLARRGVSVTLLEMKPEKYSPAHQMAGLCELVCSNSLKANATDNACGLLKEEMRRLGSLVIACADQTAVPAGGALAVDREAFSALVTEKIRAAENITIKTGEVTELPKEGAVIATGPLTSEVLAEKIQGLTGGMLSFFDAAAPIVTRESVNMDRAYFAARYGKGTADYINCPMTKEEYEAFYEALVTAECAPLHGVDKPKVFEGCMPVEVMAKRGEKTLLFGPLRPVGLDNPETGEKNFAVVQLRQDNTAGTLYNLVGFQTNLKWGEQKRVFSMIPALGDAEFVRYGVMHRNSYINSPKLLTNTFKMREKNLYFAGQITGVEGYVESAASGLLAGINAARDVLGKPAFTLPEETMLGALSAYISSESVGDFQPMNANFGILKPLGVRIKAKKDRYAAMAARSLEIIEGRAKDAD